MPTLKSFARIFPGTQRTDEARVIVTAAGYAWSVSGELTTPGFGQTPRFAAASIRAVNDDGSENGELLDYLDSNFVQHLELQAAESLAEERAEARAFIRQSHAEQDLCDRIDAARSVA
ncbi:hypothetical protein AB4Z48_18205 [Cupriavidus sp. 2TAF22]|uniref:hypothetical protein n=1 Tax=unclassified Cupriavidus TaxID=2640874 RepID=UPI003F92EBD6